MRTIIGLLLLIIILCIFLGNKKYDNLEMFLKSKGKSKGFLQTFTGKNKGILQTFTGEIKDTVKFADGMVKDWVPNITWYFRGADKIIEWERAKQGLPPLIPATPQVSVNVRANNNKYRLTGGFW